MSFAENTNLSCAQMDLNHRPLPYKGSALTAELWAHIWRTTNLYFTTH